MAETSFPTYVITQEPGMVPKKKGPFYSTKMVEEFLREAYKLNPEIICIVMDMTEADATWYPEHGHAWLDIYGDRRRRHPRRDQPKGSAALSAQQPAAAAPPRMRCENCSFWASTDSVWGSCGYASTRDDGDKVAHATYVRLGDEKQAELETNYVFGCVKWKSVKGAA